jgi:pilus assembly protein CpaC
MLQQRTKQQINGLPGLMQLPVIGSLFRSRDYINNQTELVVIVTPYIVHPVAQAKLSKPDDRFEDPSDSASILFGKLNRTDKATVAAAPGAPRSAQTNYGFILD